MKTTFNGCFDLILMDFIYTLILDLNVMIQRYGFDLFNHGDMTIHVDYTSLFIMSYSDEDCLDDIIIFSSVCPHSSMCLGKIAEGSVLSVILPSQTVQFYVLGEYPTPAHRTAHF